MAIRVPRLVTLRLAVAMCLVGAALVVPRTWFVLWTVMMTFDLVAAWFIAPPHHRRWFAVLTLVIYAVWLTLVARPAY